MGRIGWAKQWMGKDGQNNRIKQSPSDQPCCRNPARNPLAGPPTPAPPRYPYLYNPPPRPPGKLRKLCHPACYLLHHPDLARALLPTPQAKRPTCVCPCSLGTPSMCSEWWCAQASSQTAAGRPRGTEGRQERRSHDAYGRVAQDHTKGQR